MGVAGRARFSHLAWFSDPAKPGQFFESSLMAIFCSDSVPDIQGPATFNRPVEKVRAE